MIAYVGIALPYNYLSRLLPPILANANNDDILLMFLLLYTTNITTPIIIVILWKFAFSHQLSVCQIISFFIYLSYV